jgi:hypothetical protein
MPLFFVLVGVGVAAVGFGVVTIDDIKEVRESKGNGTLKNKQLEDLAWHAFLSCTLIALEFGMLYMLVKAI